eukprot:4367356-Pyramimonas_sp.AAC.1
MVTGMSPLAWQARSVPMAVAAMAAFIMLFSMSWASGFWVLVSEMFSMRHKAAATRCRNPRRISNNNTKRNIQGVSLFHTFVLGV